MAEVTLQEPKQTPYDYTVSFLASIGDTFLTPWLVMLVLPLANASWTPGYWQVFWVLVVVKWVTSSALFGTTRRLFRPAPR
jgi:hypothetical protein